MKHEDRSLFDDKLASQLRWYGATAVAAGVLAAAPAADAQVVYNNVFPDILIDSSTIPGDSVSLGLFIDFDEDGDSEVILIESAGIPYSYAAWSGSQGDGPDSLIAIVGQTFVGAFTYNYFIPLSSGATISSGNVNPVANYYFFPTFTYQGYNPTGWLSAGQAFAGVQFNLDGNTHYGWIRLDFGGTAGSFTVLDYAYEATPGAPITAGDVGTAITLNGGINTATFGSAGGSLDYTFKVANNSAASATGDLWVDVFTSGGSLVLRQQLINDGTVGAGGVISTTESLTVPPGAPPGTYTVVYKIGSFPGTVIDSETFLVTVTSPRLAADADYRPFALLAENEFSQLRTRDQQSEAQAPVQADAEVRMTLSDAYPNPFSRTTELTVEVAEAQHVQVAVFDALGRQVATLHDGELAADRPHRLTFDAADLPAGVYFVRTTGQGISDVRTLTLTR